MIETLLDSLAWALECDPSLAHRGAAGELSSFPLPRLTAGLYERRHPDALPVESFHLELRAEAQRHEPLGADRVIRHSLVDDAGAILAYCGFARGKVVYLHSAFTEGPEQIFADISRGFTYWYTSDARPSFEVEVAALQRVKLEHGELCVGRAPLSVLPMAPFDDESRWRAWWELAASDAEYYVRQRKAAG